MPFASFATGLPAGIPRGFSIRIQFKEPTEKQVQTWLEKWGEDSYLLPPEEALGWVKVGLGEIGAARRDLIREYETYSGPEKGRGVGQPLRYSGQLWAATGFNILDSSKVWRHQPVPFLVVGINPGNSITPSGPINTVRRYITPLHEGTDKYKRKPPSANIYAWIQNKLGIPLQIPVDNPKPKLGLERKTGLLAVQTKTKKWNPLAAAIYASIVERGTNPQDFLERATGDARWKESLKGFGKKVRENWARVIARQAKAEGGRPPGFEPHWLQAVEPTVLPTVIPFMPPIQRDVRGRPPPIREAVQQKKPVVTLRKKTAAKPPASRKSRLSPERQQVVAEKKRSTAIRRSRRAGAVKTVKASTLTRRAQLVNQVKNLTERLPYARSATELEKFTSALERAQERLQNLGSD